MAYGMTQLHGPSDAKNPPAGFGQGRPLDWLVCIISIHACNINDGNGLARIFPGLWSENVRFGAIRRGMAAIATILGRNGPVDKQ